MKISVTGIVTENGGVDGSRPRWVLEYLTVNETGPAGVQEPTIGAHKARGEHLARNTGPSTQGERAMKAVVECCAGIDVGKKVLNVCVMRGPAELEPEVELGKFGTFNAELDRLREWLLESGCTQVVMESTGSYWKPVYAALEGSGIKVILANGEDVKARRGHKTDWNDCQFLANLL